MNNMTQKGMLLTVLILSTQTYSATPLFTLLPHTPNTFSIPENGSFFAQYIVANNATSARTIVPKSMRGVTQITSPGYCSHPQLLKPGESCILNLEITASEIGNGLYQGPEVCKTRYGTKSPDLQYCARPAAENLLNISVVPNTSYRRVVPGYINNGTLLPYAFATDDAGKNWTSVPLEMPAGSTGGVSYSISCDITGLHCVASALAEISNTAYPISYTSNDGGFSWNKPVALSNPAGTQAQTFNTVSCSDSGEHCTFIQVYDTRGYVFQSDDGGNTWGLSVPVNEVPDSVLNAPFTVSCDANGIKCVAAGIFLNNGEFLPAVWVQDMETNTWIPHALTPPKGSTESVIRTIRCGTTAPRCIATGYGTFNGLTQIITYYSTDRGHTWSEPQVLSGNNNAYDASCSADGLFCVIAGETNVDSTNYSAIENLTQTTMDGGKTWSQPVLTPDVGTIGNSFNAIFCDASGIDCTTIGSGYADNSTLRPEYLYSSRSTNGGNTWSPAETFTQAYTLGVNSFGMGGSR